MPKCLHAAQRREKRVASGLAHMRLVKASISATFPDFRVQASASTAERPAERARSSTPLPASIAVVEATAPVADESPASSGGVE